MKVPCSVCSLLFILSVTLFSACFVEAANDSDESQEPTSPAEVTCSDFDLKMAVFLSLLNKKRLPCVKNNLKIAENVVAMLEKNVKNENEEFLV